MLLDVRSLSNLRVLMLCVALTLAGCASARERIGRVFDEGEAGEAASESAAAKGGQRVYYVGLEGLRVYGKPSSSARVLGTLSLHQKVTRSKVENGYAHVTSADGSLVGWVDNARLLWRLPAADAAEEAAPAAAAEPASPATPEGAVTEPASPSAAQSPGAAETGNEAVEEKAVDDTAADQEEAQTAPVPRHVDTTPTTTLPDANAPSVFDAY